MVQNSSETRTKLIMYTIQSLSLGLPVHLSRYWLFLSILSVSTVHLSLSLFLSWLSVSLSLYWLSICLSVSLFTGRLYLSTVRLSLSTASIVHLSVCLSLLSVYSLSLSASLFLPLQIFPFPLHCFRYSFMTGQRENAGSFLISNDIITVQPHPHPRSSLRPSSQQIDSDCVHLNTGVGSEAIEANDIYLLPISM